MARRESGHRTPRTKRLTSPSATSPGVVAVGDQDEIFAVDSTQAFLDPVNADDTSFPVALGARHAVFPPGSWEPRIEWARARSPAEASPRRTEITRTPV